MDGRGAQVLELSPAYVDEHVSRMHPCTAWRGDSGTICGTTPTRYWHKSCQYGHNRDIYLCGTHEGMTVLNASTCRECADRGTTTLAWLTLLGRGD